MALTTQNANLVRQKAYNAVYTGKLGKSPLHFYLFKALFLHLAANKSNPDLAFVAYAAEDITTNGGFAPTNAAAACTLYAWYGNARRTTGTTAAFQQIFDGTDNNTSTATITTTLINKTGQSFSFMWPDGMPLATGLVIASDTTATGATENSAADATDGFAIVSA